MADGLVHASEEGTPQGSPLSPLLSNVMLDDLDWELDRRGHRFVRYADDGRIYVRSERAGQRVMQSITQYIQQCLKLRVNRQKSAVAPAVERPLLGFRFFRDKAGKVRVTVAPKALKRAEDRLRELTTRNWGVSMERRVKEINASRSDGRPTSRWPTPSCRSRSSTNGCAAGSDRRAGKSGSAHKRATGTSSRSVSRPGCPQLGSLAEGVLARRWVLATPKSTAKRLLAQDHGPKRIHRSLPTLPGMLSEPPGADPHAGWCGRGQGKPGLYPISVGARG